MKPWNAFLLISLPLSLALAESPKTLYGPHGGIVVENAAARAEVRVDSKRSQVDVYLLRYSAALRSGTPASLELFSSPDSKSTIELRAIDPAGAIPHFQGSMDRSLGSTIGFELRFGLDSGTLKWLGSAVPAQPGG